MVICGHLCPLPVFSLYLSCRGQYCNTKKEDLDQNLWTTFIHVSFESLKMSFCVNLGEKYLNERAKLFYFSFSLFFNFHISKLCYVLVGQGVQLHNLVGKCSGE